jgi:hypothetical protein
LIKKRKTTTAPTQMWRFSGLIKLFASIKVCAWLIPHVRDSEIATFGQMQTVMGKFKKRHRLQTREPTTFGLTLFDSIF